MIELGDGAPDHSPWPVTAVGVTGAGTVTANDQQTCATRNDGTVACWGQNQWGELGDGTTVDRPTAISLLRYR